jgi:uncharacterized membrane protein YccF (DUF307 family)
MSVQDRPPVQQNVIIQQASSGEPGCLVQALWFVFVGWWLGGIVLTVAWLLNITIIGLPFGMAMLNNIPKVLALQNPKRRLQVVQGGDLTRVIEADVPQMNFLVRSAYFLLVGWWWSAVWMSLAYLVCATLILMPIGFGMFRMTPAMTTLRRY